MLADLRSLLVNGVQVLSSPDDRICSALGCNTILNVEVIPLRAKFGKSLAQGFVQGNFSLRQKSFSFHEALGRHTHGYRTGAAARSPSRRASVSARWDGTGNSQEVQHRLAGRRSTTLLPFPLSPEPTKAEIQLSMVLAKNPSAPS